MRQIVRYLAATMFGVASFASSAPLFAQQGYVHEVSGDVTGHVGGGRAAQVGKGMTIPINSTITTGANSYAILKFEDGTVIVLKENTAFQVQAYTFQRKVPENANAVFNLLRGGLRLVTGLVTSRNRSALRVATPHATMGIRGTDFTAELTNPLLVGVQVGVVSLTNAAGTVLVSAGQFASVLSAAQIGSLIPAAQVPAGALQFPNITLPPASPLPGPPPSAGVIGGGGVGGGMTATGAAAVAGAGVAAGIAASNEGNATTSHHPQ